MVVAEQKMSLPQLNWPNAQKAAFWLALVTSIVLNISFVGGYFRAESETDQVRQAGGAASVIADRMGLDAGQRALFQDLRGEARAEGAVLQRVSAAAKVSFWQELAKPQPDDAVLKTLVERVAQENTTFTLSVAALMRRFMDALTPDQMRNFVEVVQHRPLMEGRFLMGGR